MHAIPVKVFTYVAIILSLGLNSAAYAQQASDDAEKILRIYQDADLSRHAESAVSIQRGIEVAFDEIGNQIRELSATPIDSEKMA